MSEKDSALSKEGFEIPEPSMSHESLHNDSDFDATIKTFQEFDDIQKIEMFKALLSGDKEKFENMIKGDLLSKYADAMESDGKDPHEAFKNDKSVYYKAIAGVPYANENERSLNKEKVSEEEYVIDLMLGSKSKEEWNNNCDKVKEKFGDYPDFWYKDIVSSGLADEVQSNWGK
jgi:hypothetical protein